MGNRYIGQSFTGWPAILVSVTDNTYRKNNPNASVTSVHGELKMLPNWEGRQVQFDESDDEIYDLDAYFSVYATNVAVWLLDQKFGTRLIISGKIAARSSYANELTHLTSQVTISDVLRDPSRGKHNPLSGALVASSKDFLVQAAKNGRAKLCPRCDGQTHKVVGRSNRFCPICVG